MDDPDMPTVACPTCNGPLTPGSKDWHCTVGHDFTAADLVTDQSKAILESLWYALRAIDDRRITTDFVAAGLERDGFPERAKGLRSQSAEAQTMGEALYELLQKLEGLTLPRLRQHGSHHFN